MHKKGWLAMTDQTHQTYQTAQTRRFALRYGGWMRALASLTALGPQWSHVDLSADELQVRMGWGFQAHIPRRSIIRARPLGQQRDIWYAVGIHTLRGGRWIVNGSLHGVVTLEIEPPVRARVFGLPIRLRWLAMSLRDPDGFLAALGAPTV
jgi:hypothetical protein